jgi:hypothetical protein
MKLHPEHNCVDTNTDAQTRNDGSNTEWGKVDTAMMADEKFNAKTLSRWRSDSSRRSRTAVKTHAHLEQGLACLLAG